MKSGNGSFPVLLGPSRVGRIRWVQAQDYVKIDRNVRGLGRVFLILNCNVTKSKYSQPSLGVFGGTLSKWEPCKSCKYPYKPLWFWVLSTQAIQTLYFMWHLKSYHFAIFLILVPWAHDPSGLRQESRALVATISGMHHRCRLRETGWAEFGYFPCYFKMVAPRALVFRPLVKGNEALGTRL